YANSAIVTNSTFFSNPGISTMAGGVNSVASSNPVITNCILVGNSGNISNTNSTPVIKNSLIGGSNGSGASWNTAFGTDAGGNIDADPQFTTDFRLSPCSPAKDAGNNTGVSSVDLDNNPRIVGTTVDMGCYEFQTTLSAYGSIVYVNAAATGLNNGTSWANAFTDLSDALKLNACSGINTIYVSKGTYYASLNNSYGLAGDYQEPTFALRNGISILGGFSVADGATTLASRNYTLYKTILSGDANKDGILENNGKAVVTALAGVTSSTILDGFTIQEGYNNTTGTGAGMYIHTASPTINNCTFTGNAISFATGQGAGVYVNAGNPVFNNCKFYSNTITSTTASTGGGVYNVSAGATFNDCEFKGNIVTSSSNAFGAGINNYSCNTITINRCKFEGNIANAPNNAGAGIYATISAPMLVD
ncbi:MAG: choice-of-anchor Q domain-containing protein, partial [Dolichospermum sp.]